MCGAGEYNAEVTLGHVYEMILFYHNQDLILSALKPGRCILSKGSLNIGDFVFFEVPK